MVLVTCAGLGTTTGRALLAAASGVVIEVSLRQTTRTDVEEALQNAERSGCQVLGLALLRATDAAEASDGAGIANPARTHLAEVARGSAVTLAGAVTSTVATFGLVIVVTLVSPEEAGRFFATTAVFLMALAAAGLGTDTGLARFVLRANSRDEVRRLIRG